MFTRFSRTGLVVCLLTSVWQCSAEARDTEVRWKRTISYQNKKDLFYNFHEGPGPSGTATAMYVSPRPIPPHVGHTYMTYQPLMPQEYLYQHTRSHYSYARGCGWTRSKVRYRTCGLRLQDMWHDLSSCY